MKSIVFLAFLIGLSSAARLGDRLYNGQCFGWDQRMFSAANCMYMQVQRDGNMVIYRNRDDLVVWATGTNSRGGYRTCMNGNLVLQNAAQQTIWTANANGRGRVAWLQDSGELTLRDQNNDIVWRSGRTAAC